MEESGLFEYWFAYLFALILSVGFQPTLLKQKGRACRFGVCHLP